MMKGCFFLTNFDDSHFFSCLLTFQLVCRLTLFTFSFFLTLLISLKIYINRCLLFCFNFFLFHSFLRSFVLTLFFLNTSHTQHMYMRNFDSNSNSTSKDFKQYYILFSLSLSLYIYRFRLEIKLKRKRKRKTRGRTKHLFLINNKLRVFERFLNQFFNNFI